MRQQGQLEGKPKMPFSKRQRHSFDSASREKYVLMGDFNAFIGSRECVGDLWDGVVSDAGKELLSFLSVHQATVCNTWYMKSDIHKQM